GGGEGARRCLQGSRHRRPAAGPRRGAATDGPAPGPPAPGGRGGRATRRRRGSGRRGRGGQTEEGRRARRGDLQELAEDPEEGRRRAEQESRRRLRLMRPETLTCRVGAGLSGASTAGEAAGEAAREARAALGGADVDLAYLFLSADHIDAAEDGLAAASEELDAENLIGCVAEGVVGRDRELEHGPGAAVWAAALPEARVETFHAVAVETDEGVAIAGVPGFEDADLVT